MSDSCDCPSSTPQGLVACQAPLTMGFPRQEYWSGLPFPSPGDFPDPGIEPRSPTLQAVSLLTELGGPFSPLSLPSIQATLTFKHARLSPAMLPLSPAAPLPRLLFFPRLRPLEAKLERPLLQAFLESHISPLMSSTVYCLTVGM